jgi:hypothetical protein
LAVIHSVDEPALPKLGNCQSPHLGSLHPPVTATQFTILDQIVAGSGNRGAKPATQGCA